ncbi:MAG TPA: hypothetical protein VJB66_05375 [Candidatus Nanoarchaeia archaeon]|nr:hypothetical protein [Candidatus Nanoarchaeia archaeon]
MKDNMIGSWAFIIGVVAAVVLGIGLTADYKKVLVWILFFLGLVIGMLNVTAKETQSFLTAGTLLALMSFLGLQVGVFTEAPFVVNILNGILTLFIPATIIVALKAVYMLAQD